MRCFVIMGVAGCGKSTVGAAVAAATGIAYIDGDDLHPDSNIRKMASGHPLTDSDRAPWLDAVGRKLADHDGPVIVGCSALRRAYRDRIRTAAREPVCFLHLDADQAVIARRMARRKGHFMPAGLLDSQFATLEPLEGDEAGARIDIDAPPHEVVKATLDLLRSWR